MKWCGNSYYRYSFFPASYKWRQF